MPILMVWPDLKMAQPTLSVPQTAGTPDAVACVATGALVATGAGAWVAVGACVAGAAVAGAAVAGAAVAGAAVAGAAVAGAAVGVAQAASNMLTATSTERIKVRRFMDCSSKGLV